MIIITNKIDVYRGRINQPSQDQPLHNMHWQKCIVVDEMNDSKHVTIYFTDGPVYSMIVPRTCIDRIK